MRMSAGGSVYICGFPPKFQGSYLAFLLVFSLGFVSQFSFSFFLFFPYYFLISSLVIPNILRDAESTLLSHPHKEGPPSISLK